ncbi:MAG: LamG domain-containing protein, partial [Clostridia bacterium]|nr:LamG domain-containing protein [Clostridia bacterium]
MKKHISFLLALCMLFTMLPMGMNVAATTVTSDANLVFDMDLSNCSATSVKQVADKSGAGMVDSITYGYQTASGTTNNPPAFGTVEETGTPCLTFANYNGTSAVNGGRVVYANFKNDKIAQRNIANSNAVTIETWAKFDPDGQSIYSKLFQYGCKCPDDQRAHTAFGTQFNTAGSNNINFYADRGGTHNGNGSNGAFTISEDYAGKWAHYVFVREWLPGESAGKGTWQLTLYINGKKTVKTATESAKTNYTVPFTGTVSHYPTTLMIGCDDNNGAGRSFSGSIATFKMYDDARTEAEVKADYNSTKSDFYLIVPTVESVTFKNQNGEKIDNISVPIEEATKIEVMAEIKDCPEDVIGILALYNESGALVSASLAQESAPDDNAVTSMRARLEDVSGIDKAMLYIWNATDKLNPLFTPASIGGEPEPLKITGGFYAGEQEISYAKGNTNISAKLNLSAGEPPESLTATLKLMREKEAVYEASKTITFTDGVASAELAYEANEAYPTLPTLQEDDELVVAVTDGTDVLFEKRLAYSDPSKIVDVILVAGQSNAVGQGGSAALSLKPEADTVYYNTIGNKHLSTNGNQGWDSALGKTWYEKTGRKVLIVKAAWGGTGFPNQLNIDTNEEYAAGSKVFGYWDPDNDMPLANT